MAPLTIASFTVHDVRFPTNVTGDGTDAMNKECDYSAAYIDIQTSGDLKGQGMTFTIGRGNEIVCFAINEVAKRIIGMDVESIFADMGAFWSFLVADPQHRWLGPEKGVIHLATAAISNAVWDMFAKARGKPLWKLIVDFTPEEFVQATAFRYITDAITKEEALALLKAKESGKKAREAEVKKRGYPAYTTSVGWLGYSDEKVKRLTKSSLAQGFNHFKLKVGADADDDLRRGRLIRSIIDDPANMPKGRKPISPESIANKNAGPTGCVLMVDANQVWDVAQAVEYMKKLEPLKPWFIEEPTAPDDAVGHAEIRKALKPYGIGVATGEHAHNRMMFKQLLKLDAIDVCQIDSCRLGGVNEVLSVLLMSAKYGVPVCPHAGGVGLCARLNTLMGQTQQELASYGSKQFSGKEHRGSLILQLMTRFATSFISSIDGTSSEISTKELCGGARIYYIFNSVFGNSLETIDPTHNLSTQDIRTAIRNSTGPRPSLFVPELAFDLLVKPQIKLLEIPSQRCVELVYEELIKICHTCGSQELSRFPRLQGKLIEVVSDLLRERLGPASNYVESLISIQRAYINTNHPNFLGAAAAMSSVIQSKNDKEKQAAQAEERRRKDALRKKQLGVNGAATPDEDDPPEDEKPQTVAARSAAAKAARSASPAVGVGRVRENGQSFSQQSGTRDSFLNYFFGKDGAGMSSNPLPQPVSHAPRHVSQSIEPSFAQSFRRPDHGSIAERSPRSVVTPLPTFNDDYAAPSEYGGDSHLFGEHQSEPALTEREALETELIRRLISSYFNIVRETIADQVPKAIMHLLVNHSRDEVQNRLVSELYREDLFGDLLYEDDGIKKEREKCEKLLSTYKEAAKIVGEVL